MNGGRGVLVIRVRRDLVKGEGRERVSEQTIKWSYRFGSSFWH
jgi:hypothetical protein